MCGGSCGVPHSALRLAPRPCGHIQHYRARGGRLDEPTYRLIFRATGAILRAGRPTHRPRLGLHNVAMGREPIAPGPFAFSVARTHLFNPMPDPKARAL